MPSKTTRVASDLDQHESLYAEGLQKKLVKNHPEAEFREFQTGCGSTVRVYKNGRMTLDGREIRGAQS